MCSNCPWDGSRSQVPENFLALVSNTNMHAARTRTRTGTGTGTHETICLAQSTGMLDNVN